VYFSITPADRAQAEQIRLLRVGELMESHAVATYNDFAVPLLNADDPAAWFEDKERLTKARQDVAAARQDLERAAADLDQMQVTDADLKKSWHLAQEQVAAWSRFFDLFQKVLARDAPPPPEELRSLRQQAQTIRNLRKER
jgi:hypothetical protein